MHLSPFVLARPTHHFFPFRAFAQSSSSFHPTPSYTHQVSFCDSYGVDPTHCNFMLSGLETSLDLLARSFSFVATIRLILPFYWFTTSLPLPPFFLLHSHPFVFSPFPCDTSPLLRYTYRLFSHLFIHIMASLELGLVVVYHILVAFSLYPLPLMHLHLQLS